MSTVVNNVQHASRTVYPGKLEGQSTSGIRQYARVNMNEHEFGMPSYSPTSSSPQSRKSIRPPNHTLARGAVLSITHSSCSRSRTYQRAGVSPRNSSVLRMPQAKLSMVMTVRFHDNMVLSNASVVLKTFHSAYLNQETWVKTSKGRVETLKRSVRVSARTSLLQTAIPALDSLS